MFEHFTFGQQARSVDEASYIVSPYDRSPEPSQSQMPSPASTSRSSSISNLLSSLDEHNLQPERDDISRSYCGGGPEQYNRLSPEFPILQINDNFDQQNENILSSLVSCLSPGAGPPCRRWQRQRNTQLLSMTSQKASLGELVESMVASSEQCNVTAPPLEISSPSPDPDAKDIAVQLQPIIPAADEDEGFCEGSEDDTSPEAAQRLLYTLRRAGGPMGIRKYCRRARDADNLALREEDRGFVHCPPRIRKRVTRTLKPR